MEATMAEFRKGYTKYLALGSSGWVSYSMLILGYHKAGLIKVRRFNTQTHKVW